MIQWCDSGAGLLFHLKVDKRLFARGKVSIGLMLGRLKSFVGMDFMFPFVYVGANPVFQSFSHVEWNDVICVRLLSFCPWTGSGELFQCLRYGADLLFHHIISVVQFVLFVCLSGVM